ncbi:MULTISPECIES: hypothetical protein [Rhizobium/Agrobacterium group]|uniref:hypothetical protein n=1 Tax=Rhizobium/Agrobacterium group TaxID=227290 RepID=UPI00110E331A|nr:MULTISPECIES: hypothetical protein [Rhizobium/Agrobacterium group]NWJ25887.1 hypothetical protein [Rhizobium sp. RM]TMV15830.1 hypothetical protein BJG94_22140 [Rhizobium sp. Td3]UXS01072.1 hypothetical protein FY156_05970 [Agrobacterium tumefaciens]
MWIEVTAVGNSQKFAINFDHVLQILPLAQGAMIVRGPNDRVQVMESYDYLVARLHAATSK